MLQCKIDRIKENQLTKNRKKLPSHILASRSEKMDGSGRGDTPEKDETVVARWTEKETTDRKKPEHTHTDALRFLLLLLGKRPSRRQFNIDWAATESRCRTPIQVLLQVTHQLSVFIRSLLREGTLGASLVVLLEGFAVGVGAIAADSGTSVDTCISISMSSISVEDAGGGG